MHYSQFLPTFTTLLQPRGHPPRQRLGASAAVRVRSGRSTNALRLQGQVKALVIRKCHNKSVVALAHKILRTIYAMLSSGTHYKDRVVDCEALNVVRDAPSLVEDAAQARLHRRPRYRLKERFIPAALPRPGRASGQDSLRPVGVVFHTKRRI